jgi:hypothetical protein
MKGDRADSLGVRRYCAYTGTHYPYLHNAGGIPPWQRIETQQWRLDAHTNSVMIPMGYKKKFMVKNPFQQSGNLRGTDYLTFATVLMDYIEFISDFPPAYKLFYRMFGHDMTDLLAPFFSDKDIDDLENRILETVGAHEGLFPDSEALMVYHQLVHLPSFIQKWGPLAGWWALPGERSIAAVKRHVPRGGASYEKTVNDRYVGVQDDRTALAYDFDRTDPLF